ncbi:Carbohydrate esterase family 9 protein [Mycena indigotica]|uniref:Carbohydrate esterase family 9 protein n=1 Tax=Mycena indigotica TaxID=2126181 RepID=A0A8H6T820_9AGAR|nr:Carbohydrate esterase family 9 protein [Mycena indigotica]KAF7312052.1 Carbohydrate esterase family 9 protein [Mycena indigotica]
MTVFSRLVPTVVTSYIVQTGSLCVRVSPYDTDNEKYYDLAGSLGFITSTFVSLYYPSLKAKYIRGTALPSLLSLAPRQLLVTTALGIWSLRLGTFLAMRAIKAGSDSRFDDVKSQPGIFTFYWLAQATWVVLVGLPVYMVNVIPPTLHPLLGMTDVLAGTLFTGSFLFEVIADKQKSAWRKAKDSKEHEEKFISSGLWSISRHPKFSYVGEVGNWIAIWALAAGSIRTPNYPLGTLLLAGISPLFTWFLVRKVSGVPPLEAAGDKRFGGDPKWEEYKKFVPGTRPHLLQNARLWTGEKNGTQVLLADILIDRGLIKAVGKLEARLLKQYGPELVVIDAEEAWITPGIVDLHSHMGDFSLPSLNGASDGNSPKGLILPWLRSIDGLNTHDLSYETSIAGGITTALVLPGSGDSIGGQAFVIKPRKTDERSTTAMVLEPPYNINSSFPVVDGPPRWRHMKHACGENPSGWYGVTRMDTIWAFREAYNTAKQIQKKQDAYCSRVMSNDWEGLGEYPESLQWESLVDVLRGKVKVNVHCYMAEDFDGLVRLSNEFEFPIAAFHHASEAYLVPDLIKKTYGPTPAIALFATNSRYKLEAYRASEFAPRILATHGIDVVMKSDHPVLNSRYLVYEAQQAHFYGFPANLAMASVTTTPARAMGMDHRIGFIREGWDADLVIWDSHPLNLGATPKQVFIDGIPQLKNPHIARKPLAFQNPPIVPDFDDDAKEAVEYEGLPPLDPKPIRGRPVVFVNVRSVLATDLSNDVEELFSASSDDVLGTAVAVDGRLVCVGECRLDSIVDAEVVNLQGGAIWPALTTFGAPLGLEHIQAEPSTVDGSLFDVLSNDGVPAIVGGNGAAIRAVDGLQFLTRDALLAYRSGVTTGIVAPLRSSVVNGLGVSFSLAASNKLEPGAVLHEVTALHTTVSHLVSGSISTQIAVLRRLLLHPVHGPLKGYVQRVLDGDIPLVIEAYGADIIATLVLLKREVEQVTAKTIKMTITGATEAHLLAKELGEAGIGVVLVPARATPTFWENRRILPGPPLTEHTDLSRLIAHNVTVGLGVLEIWDARNTRFEAAWAQYSAGGKISKSEAFAIVSTNLERLLSRPLAGHDLAVLSSRRKLVDVL